MKSVEQIMDRVRLHTVATVAVLMLMIVLHKHSPFVIYVFECVVVGLYYAQFSVAEEMCDIIHIDKILRESDDCKIELDKEYFDKLEEVLK